MAAVEVGCTVALSGASCTTLASRSSSASLLRERTIALGMHQDAKRCRTTIAITTRTSPSSPTACQPVHTRLQAHNKKLCLDGAAHTAQNTGTHFCRRVHRIMDRRISKGKQQA